MMQNAKFVQILIRQSEYKHKYHVIFRWYKFIYEKYYLFATRSTDSYNLSKIKNRLYIVVRCMLW